MGFIADRLSRIKPSPTNAAQGKFLEMKAAGKDVIGLAAGEPDFETPENIKDAGDQAPSATTTRSYTDVAGTPALRQAICAKFKRDNGLDYKPDADHRLHRRQADHLQRHAGDPRTPATR